MGDEYDGGATIPGSPDDAVEMLESPGVRFATAHGVGMPHVATIQLQTQTKNVTGIDPAHGGSGDPSPFTALGGWNYRSAWLDK